MKGFVPFLIVAILAIFWAWSMIKLVVNMARLFSLTQRLKKSTNVVIAPADSVWDSFDDDEWNGFGDNDRRYIDDDEPLINPATGLPMYDGMDIAGNPCGFKLNDSA